MPTQTFKLAVEASTRGEDQLARMERALKNIEVTSNAVRNTVIGVATAATAMGAAMHASAAGVTAFAKSILVADTAGSKLLNTYRALRIASAAPLGGAAIGLAAGSVVGGVIAQKLVQISNENAKLIERNAMLAAQSGRSFSSVQTFGTASTISGRDLSGLAAFSADDVRTYIAELEKIADPIERARRAQELFGKEAATAYSLIGTNVGKIITSSQELTQQLDHPTRESVQRLRDTIKAFEEFSPFDRAKESLRQFREEAKQGITIRVAAVADFGRGLGNRLGELNAGGGMEGGVAFDSGDRPGLGIPTLDEFRRMAMEVIGTSKRFQTDSDGNAIGVAPDLLPKANRGGLGLGRAFQSGSLGTEDSVLAALKDVQERRQKLRTILATPGLGDEDYKSISGRLGALVGQESVLQAQADQIVRAKKGATLTLDSTTFIAPMSTRAPSLGRKGLDGFVIPEGTVGISGFTVTEADRRKFEEGAYNPGNAVLNADRDRDRRNRDLDASFARQFVAFQEQKINLLTGPGGELAAIQKIYDLKIAGLEQELKYGNEIFDVTERRARIEQDREIALINLRRQRRDDARGLASDFVGSLQAGRPQDFFLREGGRLVNQIGTNALAGPFQSIIGSLGKFGGSIPGIGGLLKGTLLDPGNATPVDKNTAATERNTAALERITFGGGTPGGGIPGIVSSALGLPGGIFQGAGKNPLIFSATTGNGVDIFGNGGPIGIGSAIPPGGKFSGLGKNIGIAGAIAGGAFGAYDGFKAGGAQGILTGTASLAGAGAAVLSLAGVAGPAAPIALGIGMTLMAAAKMIGDPKKNESLRINQMLNDSLYSETSPMAFNYDRMGRSYDSNKRGDMRPIVVNNYYDMIDASGIMDRRELFADANRQAMIEGHGINRTMQEVVLAN